MQPISPDTLISLSLTQTITIIVCVLGGFWGMIPLVRLLERYRLRLEGQDGRLDIVEKAVAELSRCNTDLTKNQQVAQEQIKSMSEKMNNVTETIHTIVGMYTGKRQPTAKTTVNTKKGNV